MSQKEHISTISRHLNAFGWKRYIILFAAIMVIAAFRMYSPLLNGHKIDWLFGMVIILFVFELTIASKLAQKILNLLGKNLFNVFLFHTFIYYYFWRDFIYSFKQPLLIFVVLLLICIAVSESIEYIKRHIEFYVFTKKIQHLRVPISMEIPFRQDGVSAQKHHQGSL